MVDSTSVLIETLWNVKQNQFGFQYMKDFSINRNIMECKEKSREIHPLQKMCINRNIMECKEIAE